MRAERTIVFWHKIIKPCRFLTRSLTFDFYPNLILQSICFSPSRLFKFKKKENKIKAPLTDTGKDSKLVHRRKRPKVDTLFSSLFSDASERRVWPSAESKILASTFRRLSLYRLRNDLKLNRRSHREDCQTQDLKISNLEKMNEFLDHIFVTILTNSSLLSNWTRKNCNMSEMIRYNSNAVGRDSRDPFGVNNLLQSITMPKIPNFPQHQP